MAVQVYSGNTLVSSAAILDGVQLNQGSNMHVLSGGTAIRTSVGKLRTLFYPADIAGGVLNVFSNGVVSESFVCMRGRINVSNGGSANHTTVTSLGILDLQRGAVADNTTVSYGFMSIGYGAIANTLELLAKGSATIFSGGTANMTTISSGGHLAVYNGGIADKVQLYASGNAYVYSGGKANDLTLSSGGNLNVYAGGLVEAVTLENASLNISSGAVANGNYVNAGAELHVSKGGYVYDNTISGMVSNYLNESREQVSEDVYAKMIVSSAGSANDNTVQFLGNINVLSGGSISDTRVSSGGSIDVRVSATASQTIVTTGGLVNVYGSVNDTVVYSGGHMWVYTSGTANNTVLNFSGSCTVFSGLTTDTIVNSGTLTVITGSAAKTELNDDAQMIVGYENIVLVDGVNASAFANDTTINAGGVLSVCTFGQADNTIVNNGGYLIATADPDIIAIGGAVNNNTIMQGGVFDITVGGVASNTEIRAGAIVAVKDGGIHRGTIKFDENGGAAITVVAGGIIDFTVANMAQTDDYLINDLTAVTGAPTYTITVSENQQDGTYKLAENAVNLANGVLIAVTDGNRTLGVLEVNGDAVSIDGVNYDLNNVDNNLTLVIEGSTEGGTSQFVVGNFGTAGNTFELKSYGLGFIHSADDKLKLTGYIDTAKWILLESGDYNNDGVDGLLWQERSTGDVYVQNDLTSFDEVINKTNCLGTLEKGDQVAAAGNFAGAAGDGLLILESVDDSTTRLTVLETAGDGTQIEGELGIICNTWQIGDELQGDTGNAAEINAKNYNFEVVACGDFNNDGVDDLLLRNTLPPVVDGVKVTGSGDMFTFLTGDTEAVKAGAVPNVVYAGNITGEWDIIGTGDFNNDGTDDLLFTNGIDVIGWQLIDGTHAGSMTFGSLATDQKISGIADFDNDGTDDIIVLSAETNTLTAWKVENGAVKSIIAIA